MIIKAKARRFTNADILSTVRREALIQWLTPAREYLEERGIRLPSPSPAFAGLDGGSAPGRSEVNGGAKPTPETEMLKFGDENTGLRDHWIAELRNPPRNRTAVAARRALP